MQANVGHETHIERALRRALFGVGLRYRKDVRPVPSLRCTADVVFLGSRVCVFVDGCFWHGCPRHFSVPNTNSSWWLEKITENTVRDRRQSVALEREGWRVIRVWEHDAGRLESVVAKIRTAVALRR